MNNLPIFGSCLLRGSSPTDTHSDPIYAMMHDFSSFEGLALKSPVEGWAVSPNACTTEAISAFTSLESSFRRCRKSSNPIELKPYSRNPSCSPLLTGKVEDIFGNSNKLAELHPADLWALSPRILVLREKSLSSGESLTSCLQFW